MNDLANIELTEEIVLKLYREKGCYHGFAWIDSKLMDDDTLIIKPSEISLFFLVYKQLISNKLFGTPVSVSKSKQGLGYTVYIEKTVLLTDIYVKDGKYSYWCPCIKICNTFTQKSRNRKPIREWTIRQTS